MAGVETEVNSGSDAGESSDLSSLLSAEGRDFLIRNNGDQVKISSLENKVVALYFSASWCGPCRSFTPKLIEAYGELSSKGMDFEVVFISADRDENSFVGYFSKMPWLAIPFSDSEARKRLDARFEVQGIPHLVVVDWNGKLITEDGVEIIRNYGSDGYPFTPEKIKKMEEDEEEAKKNQTLQSVLGSPTRDFLISNNGNQVPIAELEGKIVALHFSICSRPPCRELTSILTEMYGKLKEKGESFEIVLVSLDHEEPSFEQDFAGMPWLAIPFNDKSCQRLIRYFELRTLPTLIVIGSDGKTLQANAAELVEEHGVEAYPFSPEKLKELAEKDKARMEAQTLESLLVLGEQDYVIGKGGIKVPVSDLVGKNILLYFSAHWCSPCRAFLPKLIEAYHKIKAKDDAFEVIFISSDRDQSSFDDFFATMPWLALPFGDRRKKSLSRTFKIQGIPSLIAISPTGKTVTKEARGLITAHGAHAYPFTEERIKELEVEVEEMAKDWPQKVKSLLHEQHELSLTRRRSYVCDKCEEGGSQWSFCCGECNFDLHPKCALEEKKENNDAGEGQGHDEESGKEGYVCDGEACHKV